MTGKGILSLSAEAREDLIVATMPFAVFLNNYDGARGDIRTGNDVDRLDDALANAGLCARDIRNLYRAVLAATADTLEDAERWRGEQISVMRK